jgi:CHAT domain-containing protein
VISAALKAGASLVGVVLCLGQGPTAIPTVEECLRRLAQDPRSFEPYRCLTTYGDVSRRARVLRILEELKRKKPADGRPVFYSALTRELAGEAVDEAEFEEARAKFEAEGSIHGQVAALTTLTGDRCFARSICDQRAEDLLVRAERLAESSGDLALRRLVRVWRLRKGLVEDDLSVAEHAEDELAELGGTDPLWLALQHVVARAHLRSLLGNYEAAREDYLALVEQSPRGNISWVMGKAGAAGMAAMMAMRNRFDREAAERELREALVEEERADFLLYGYELGLYATQVQLALLLGPGPEASSLLEASLAGHSRPRAWSMAYVPLWARARFAADGPADQRAAGLADADRALVSTLGIDAKFEAARSNVMRAYVLFRLGRFDEARKAGETGLALAERLRQRQENPRIRMRYEETLATLYQVLASSLLEFGGATPDAGTIEASFQTMERLRARSLLESLMAPSGPARGPSPEPAPPTLAEVQSALGEGQALVSYQVWKRDPTLHSPYERGTSWAVVVTRGSVNAVPIEGGEDLEEEVRLWLPLLERGDGSELAGSSRLAAQLLAPVTAKLGPEIRQLLIVPDGPLHRLPLDALGEAPRGSFPAERFEMVLVPSVATWLRLRTTGAGRTGLALALADAAVPAGPGPQPIPEHIRRLGDVPLPGARREAEHAVRAFPAGSRVVSGRDASEGFLKSGDLSAFSLVHLATHAVADETAPERSAVLLAPSGSGDDGLLTVPEIAALPLRGKVVVLAACESQVGAVRRGEGVLSLARSFFEAGATAVVGTLGAVRDRDAEAFFRDFYDALGEGKSVSAALAEAKRSAIHRGAPASAWSRFVLVGNGAVTPREAPARIWIWVAAAMAALALLGLSMRARSRRSRAGEENRPGPAS